MSTQREQIGDLPERVRLGLRSDCGRCCGLCCVAPAFSVSADFAIDKDAGQTCPNLLPDFRCGIHADLRDAGFPGCVVYDCFGAGPKVIQMTFGGQDWRSSPRIASPMFQVFTVMRQLHELLWYMTEALAPAAARPLRGELIAAVDQVEGLSGLDAEAILRLDVAARREEVNNLLVRASELARRRVRAPKVEQRGADLIGADLRGADLRGANLRGACLIAADLRQADLGGADVTGADFRAADLRGADFRASIFLIQSQLEAARGDATTRLPRSVVRPRHWAPASPGTGSAPHERGRESPRQDERHREKNARAVGELGQQDGPGREQGR
jgi:uncharacterized protein YjbI with pentapeptide repeats